MPALHPGQSCMEDARQPPQAPRLMTTLLRADHGCRVRRGAGMICACMSFLHERQGELAMSARRFAATMILVSLSGGCGVAPHGAQVYLLRSQQNYDEVLQRCEAGDQAACAIRPFVAMAVAQARDDVRLPWK